MKKFNKNVLRSSLLCLILVFATTMFFGCNKKNNLQKNETNIMASFYPLYIMLLNITDNVPNVNVTILAPADTGCLHDYQLTTTDMKSLEQCDILVVNGAGMEDFIDKALEIKKDRTVIASDGYSLVDDNPHIWVSVKGAYYQVQKITEGLCNLDKKNAELYKKNAEVYSNKLLELDSQMHSKLDCFAGKKIITFHEAFPYFADEFNLNLAAVIEREPGTEPTAKELLELIQIINETKADGERVALFAEPQYSSSAAEVIATETNFTVGELDPAVTGLLEKDAYINAMKKNCTVLEEYLQ